MTRRAAGAGALLLVVAGLPAACAESPGVDQAEVSRWLAERTTHSLDAELGSMWSRVEPGEPEPAEGDGVTLSFDVPERLSAVRLACLGEGSVSFVIEVTAGRTGTTRTVPDLPCDGDHDEQVIVPDAMSVRVNGFAAERAAAWHAVILTDLAEAAPDAG